MLKFGRYSYFVLSVIFLISVFVQILFAGLGLFADGTYWINHRMFVLIMELITLLMLIFGAMCRSPRIVFGYTLGLFGFIFVMYFTANMRAHVPWIAGLHPVIAMLIVIFSVMAVRAAYRLVKMSRVEKEGRMSS